MIPTFLKILFNLDQELGHWISYFSNWIYVVLAVIIFLETGIVFMFFLPGDSLLFIVGSFCGAGRLNVNVILIILSIAAIVGDSINYMLGQFFGKNYLFKFPFIKKSHIEKTELFYQKYGPKTIVLCRFVPIVRTLAPFIAGISKMPYKTFFFYNFFGGIMWVFSLVLSGYFLGQISWVKNNIGLICLAIIALSLFPIFWELLKNTWKNKS